MDKLIVLDHMEAQIMNNSATILKLLDIVHPAAKTLINIAGLRSEWTTWMVAKVDGGQGQGGGQVGTDTHSTLAK